MEVKRTIQKILQDGKKDLCEFLPTNSDFLQELVDANALGGAEMENLEDIRNRKEKRKELLEILKEKSNEAYFTFRDILKNHQTVLDDRLSKLEEKHGLSKPGKEAPKADEQKKPEATEKPEEHDEYDVMISYCWKPDGNQQKMIQLRDKLKENNLRVWMDIDEMFGNMNDRMVEGVTKSKVIVACLSEEYQNSGNCRREYEFATNKKKPIVPVKVDDHRIAEWLQLLAGNIIYREVGSEELMEKNLPVLLGDIRRHLGDK